MEDNVEAPLLRNEHDDFVTLVLNLAKAQGASGLNDDSQGSGEAGADFAQLVLEALDKRHFARPKPKEVEPVQD